MSFLRVGAVVMLDAVGLSATAERFPARRVWQYRASIAVWMACSHCGSRPPTEARRRRGAVRLSSVPICSQALPDKPRRGLSRAENLGL